MSLDSSGLESYADDPVYACAQRDRLQLWVTETRARAESSYRGAFGQRVA